MFYAKDVGLTFYDLAPLKFLGWADYADGFSKLAADWRSIEIRLSPDFHATQAGNIAWATYTFDYVIQPKKGEAMKGQARGTDILEKRGEEWLIIHEHVSAPTASDAPKEPAHKARAVPHHRGKLRRR